MKRTGALNSTDGYCGINKLGAVHNFTDYKSEACPEGLLDFNESGSIVKMVSQAV